MGRCSTWSQTASFIDLYPTPTKDADGKSKIVGQVNMEEYSAWLKENYGFELHASAQYSWQRRAQCSLLRARQMRSQLA
jgi:hypothetical protein